MKTFEMTATQLAKSIQAKETTSYDAVTASLQRISEVNPILNAVFQLQSEHALENAKLADNALNNGKTFGPLHGIPFTLKDLFDTKGVVTTAGSKMWKDRVPAHDSTIAHRLKAAGAILVGKSNTPELSLSDECNNAIYGRTNNPYDRTRTAGGSSGGAASIVAARGVPFDIGSDVGGSIRLPAHFCGVAGFKPTRGLIPTTGHTPAYSGVFTSFNHAGPIARSVDDLSLLTRILRGADHTDPFAVDTHWHDPDNVDVRELRIGWYTDDGKANVTGICGDVVHMAVDALKQIGCRTKETHPKSVSEGGELLVRHYLYDGSQSLRDLTTDWPKDSIGDELAGWLKLGGDQTIDEARAVNARLASFRHEMMRVWADADVLIAPVAPITAFKHGDADGTANSWMMQGFNLTGWPVAVIPIAQEIAGLPAGVQIIGRPMKDHEVLATAKAIEKATAGVQPPDIK
jgi:amidase